MRELASRLSCLLVLAVALDAQQFVVVPASYASQEGNSRTMAPGVVGSWREQVIVGASHLAGLVGVELHALELRREGFDEPFPAGAGNMVVTLSHTSRQPISISPSFADNAGLPSQVVFNGVVTVQASPNPSGGVPAWSPQNVLRIQFSSPFPYQGGNLCIDMVGTPVTGLSAAMWPLDAVAWNTDAVKSDLGAGTGPHANAGGDWLFVTKAELVAGGQIEMMAIGPVGGLGLGFVGHPSAVPIPLSLVGITTPGAFAYLDEIYLSSLSIFQVPSIPVTTEGLAYWDLPLPNDAWILGVDLAVQWLELFGTNPSNGIGLTVGSVQPVLDMARVVSEASSQFGTRSVTQAPILRFEYTLP